MESISDTTAEIGPMKKLIGFIFVVLFVIIMLVKVFAFSALRKSPTGSDYQIIIGGGLVAAFILIFTQNY